MAVTPPTSTAIHLGRPALREIAAGAGQSVLAPTQSGSHVEGAVRARPATGRFRRLTRHLPLKRCKRDLKESGAVEAVSPGLVYGFKSAGPLFAELPSCTVPDSGAHERTVFPCAFVVPGGGFL